MVEKRPKLGQSTRKMYMSTIILRFGGPSTTEKPVDGVLRAVTLSVSRPRLESRSILMRIVSGSYCTGEAGKSATASSSAAALLQAPPTRSRSEEEEDAQESKSLAVQYQEDLASGKRKGERVLPNLAKRTEDGEDVELDKARLKRALDEEKKRKKMGEDEAWIQTKKSKTDVTQEELGEAQLRFVNLATADSAQRHIGCQDRRSRILWRITRTRTSRSESVLY